jgi:hypothetical protein
MAFSICGSAAGAGAGAGAGADDDDDAAKVGARRGAGAAATDVTRVFLGPRAMAELETSLTDAGIAECELCGTVCVSPVASTKSSGVSCCSTRHMPST